MDSSSSPNYNCDMQKTVGNEPILNIVSRRAAEHILAFRREIDEVLLGKVEQVVLFGSRARGDATRLSDYDLAVFVRDLDERRRVDHLLSDAAYPHILAGVHIRPVALPANYLDKISPGSLASSIARDGIVVP